MAPHRAISMSIGKSVHRLSGTDTQADIWHLDRARDVTSQWGQQVRCTGMQLPLHHTG